MPDREPGIEARDLTLAYGDFVVQRDLNFTIRRGDVFVIMGGSGCGKSTVMRALIGLQRPASGKVVHGGVSLWDAEPEERERLLRRIGVSYQSGALWSSMTLAENAALPLEQFTDLDAARIRELVSLKLALVGLSGFEDYYPSEISGGMRKRAALARAMALDPEVLFFDEPSAGLDPLSARRLDDLIDPETRTLIAAGDPNVLARESEDPRVRAFLTRGEEGAQSTAGAGPSAA